MDPKATAKSKRIHSQHGRRNHPTPSSIAQRKKPSSATPGAAEEKPRRPRAAPALPSNWDRYDADAEDGGGGGGGGGEGVAVADKSSEVEPKSKGADFGYLIEQARSQPQELRGVVGLGFSSEELPFDLMQGRSSILSVKGEGLLSWCQDDNFIVDDDTSSGYEVPFLSLDLHALAAQLSKLKLSQRLFIEADLLPEDLLTDGSNDYEKPRQSETSTASEIKHGFSQPLFQRNAESDKDISSMNYVKNPNTDNEPSGVLPSKEKSQLLTTSGSTEAIGLILPSSEDRVPEKEQNRTSAFEAAAAEADLDMLLNSLSETSLSSSFADIPIEETSTSSSMKVNSSYDKIPPSTHQSTSNSRLTAMTSLDDALDDLLAETSLSSMNIPSHSSLEPNIINDSTSNKPINGPSPFDDSLDDLLAETSLGLKDQYTVPSHDQGNVSSVNHSSHSVVTRPADDIDSWLDSL